VGSDQLAEESDEPPRSLTVRAFFGLPLPEAQRSILDGYLAECARRAPQFRWTRDANLHLTVRFLGHLEVAVAEQIVERLVEADLASFDLRLGEIGSFKRGRLARVVWLGLAHGGAESKQVAAAVESECARAGLEPETRPFSPHLTLARARARDGAPLPELPAAPGMEAWRASELILYQSRLGRAGAVYEPLRTIRLR
jgi:RNA 2',3'-cyclic 3'-phosphodiesterase